VTATATAPSALLCLLGATAPTLAHLPDPAPTRRTDQVAIAHTAAKCAAAAATVKTCHTSW
jgi:hypothetical protein